MNARIYCWACNKSRWFALPVPANGERLWRFESRDRHLLTFRLWCAVEDGPFHATTETYTVPEATFWNGPDRAPESRLAETLTGMVNADVWTALTCTEVEALALVLARAGFEGVAHRIIDAHAEGDELGDQHYQLMEASA